MEKDFIKAVKKGDIATIIEMLTAHPALLEALDTDDSTPLHCAAWKGHLDTVKILLSVGAPVNVHNANRHWGTTPLHAAAHANQPAIVELLIQNGADVNALDLEGRTPMVHTTFHGAKAAARILEKHTA